MLLCLSTPACKGESPMPDKLVLRTAQALAFGIAVVAYCLAAMA